MKKTAPRAAPAAARPESSARPAGAPASAVGAPTADSPTAGAPTVPPWLAPAGAPPLTAKQDRDRAALGHLSVALGFLGPLLVWLRYRDRGPFTAQEAKEALNFAAPPSLLVLLFLLLGLLPVIGAIFSILAALVWVAMAGYGIMGGSHVTKGRPFRYPFNLRVLR